MSPFVRVRTLMPFVKHILMTTVKSGNFHCLKCLFLKFLVLKFVVRLFVCYYYYVVGFCLARKMSTCKEKQARSRYEVRKTDERDGEHH